MPWRQDVKACAASTGPQSEDRGDRSAFVALPLICPASTGPQSEDHGDAERGASPRTSSAGFNGAAVRRPRRWCANAEALLFIFLLQRGRSPKTAEIGCAVSSRTRLALLQRGRSPKTAEMKPITFLADKAVWLQRGRSPKTAEMLEAVA